MVTTWAGTTLQSTTLTPTFITQVLGCLHNHKGGPLSPFFKYYCNPTRMSFLSGRCPTHIKIAQAPVCFNSLPHQFTQSVASVQGGKPPPPAPLTWCHDGGQRSSGYMTTYHTPVNPATEGLIPTWAISPLPRATSGETRGSLLPSKLPRIRVLRRIDRSNVTRILSRFCSYPTYLRVQ
jgi:hypothetical protein